MRLLSSTLCHLLWVVIFSTFGSPTISAQPLQITDPGPEIHRILKAKERGEIDIRTSAGSLTVTGEARSDIEISGRLGTDLEGLSIFHDGRYLRLRAAPPAGPARQVMDLGAELQLRVPTGSSLNIETLEGRAQVSGIEGTIKIRTAGAAVAVQGRPRSLDITTVSGAIEIDVDTPDALLKTVSGSLGVSGRSENLVAESVSSPIRLSAIVVVEGLLRSVTGDVTVHSEPEDTARLRLETSSGSVRLALPQDLEASFDFESSADAPTPLVAGVAWSRQAGRSVARWTRGTGHRQIIVRTFDGPIRFSSAAEDK